MTLGDVCLDCRSVLKDNQSPYQSSRYCDYCLREHVLAGEQVQGPTFTDDHGKERHLFYVVCPKCDGTGTYLVSATQDGTDCWWCAGNGWIDPDREETQRMQRWSQTYQMNRQPPKNKGVTT